MSVQERRVPPGGRDSRGGGSSGFQPESVNHLLEGQGQELELNLLLSPKPDGETLQDRDIKEQTFKTRTGFRLSW